MAQQRSKGRRGSSETKNRSASRAGNSGSGAHPTEGAVDPQLHGREPSHDPDVFVDINKLRVDEIYVDVEQLEAHLALRARLANLLQVVAGVHVHLGKVEVDVKGVEANALLKVRLENLYDILDRALTTLDENPQILEGLVDTVGDTLGSVGELGQKALGPGGAVTQTLSDVGETAEQAVRPGGAASEAVGGLSNTAGQALGPGGAVGQAVGGLGQGVGQLGQGLANPGGDAGNSSPGFGWAARTILDRAKTAASELVPELMGRVRDVAGGDDIPQSEDAGIEIHPLLDADQMEQNRRVRAERRRRRRDVQLETRDGGNAATSGGRQTRTSGSHGSTKNKARQTKRGSKRGSKRSGGTSDRAKS
jgi:hypothetical protein